MDYIEYGKNVLVNILNKGTKDYSGSEEKLYVFLPKAIVVPDREYISFPFFIKKGNKYQLLFWRALNIKNFKYKIFNLSEEFYIDEKNIDIGMTQEETINLVNDLGKLYKKYEENIEENTENDIKDLEEFQDKLKKVFNDKLYYLYFNEKKVEKVEKVEKEISKTEEKNTVLQEPGNDKYTVEELVNKFKNIKINENQEYFSELENGTGLKYVSDEMFDIVYRFLQIGNVRSEYEDIEKKNKIRIYHTIKDFCSSKAESELLNSLSDSNNILQNETYRWFAVNDKGIINFRNCIKCNYSKCPLLLSAIIINYIINNEFEKKLREREEYRKKDFRSNYFEFNWNTENGLKDIPDDTFDLCEKLVDNDFIKVAPNLVDNNTLKIWYIPISCYELELLKGDFNKLEIQDRFYDRDQWYSIKRSNKLLLKYCTNYKCNYSACIFSVAGYIYYLKRMGLESKIKEDRKYYNEHKEEIDVEIDKQKQDAIKKQKKIIEEKIKDLNKYSNKISNISTLINNITTLNQRQFHMTLEGDDFKNIEECAVCIKDTFKKLEYVSDSFTMSLQNLASDKVNEFSGIQGSFWYKWNYYTLENDQLYIINGIKEFVEDYKLYKSYSNSIYKELRFKQFDYILELITNISARNFIILEGTQEEIEELFELNNGLKFVFQQNRYVVAETTIDEMYQLFLKGLNPSLRTKCLENKKIKDNFIDYIAFNKEYMPFTNTEISNYLSNFCNMNNELKLPENIYKRETIDESLSAIIGMDSIKTKVKEFEKYVMFNIKAKTLGLELANSNLHMVFTGNPGTGKTTIARIMAKMLYDLGLIKENKLIEVERKDLVAGYIGQTAIKTAEIIEKAKGGVLFVDEAYTLAQKTGTNDSFGAEAIATLIKAMEDKKDELVCIFAGYKDEMKAFLDINPGITSRIGYIFDFPDYNTDELIKIFEVKIKKMGFDINPKVPEKLRILFDYFIKRKSFGNGRFVDKVIQAILLKHSSNSENNIKEIVLEDIPEIEEMISVKKEDDYTASEMLENMIGMNSIKSKLKDYKAYNQFVKKARNEGLSLPNQNMHMIFTGNPGTGKTTVARIIAKMLYEMGIIHEDKLVEVERKDLVAEHLGQTAPKTYDVIEKAMGGVLFIDEAYSLSSKESSRDIFGEEAIATLIKAMEDHKGEFVVIFAGYSKEMHDFINTNPGISSRIGYTFDFPDYTTDELIEIFNIKMEKMGFIISKKVPERLSYIFDYFVKRKAFGNGRFVDKVIQAMLLKHSNNSKGDIKEITLDDIPQIEELISSRREEDSTASEMIEKIVGMNNIKNKLEDFKAYNQFLKEAVEAGLKLPNQNMHMIFTGNPGTGKTTVARIIARMLYEMEIIHENKLIEVERKDLVSGYVGQTAPKTSDVIERAMGGVLFIDEAYSLSQKIGTNDNSGEEVITTLIKAMEDHKGEFIVIFAGYKKEMNDFININPGIASRIGYVFDFEDYTREELCEIYYRKLDKIGFTIEENAKDLVFKVMNYFHSVENIGNGRFVDRVVQETIMKHSKNKKRVTSKIAKEEIPTIKEITELLINGKNMIDVEKITDESMYRTAVHEIGHATLGYIKTKKTGIKVITINPEGRGSLGYVSYENDYRPNLSKQELLNIITRLLAGIASEQVFFGCYETGGTSDLEKATNIARSMITKYGMGNHGLASVSYYSGEMEVVLYNQINEILDECFKKAVEIIEKNKSKMQNAIDFLFKNKEITEEEFIKEFNKKSKKS